MNDTCCYVTAITPAVTCSGDGEGRIHPNSGHSCDSSGDMLSMKVLAERNMAENGEQTGCVLLILGW